ncbi:MAG: hypothetical protein GX410_09160 [Elusimicrobia bacterium]|nr:hypothetical protein [Elusimicrobiota bacterium]
MSGKPFARLAALSAGWDAALVFAGAFAAFAAVGVNLRGFADTGIGGAIYHGLDYGYMLFSMPGEPLARFLVKYKLPLVFAAAVPACCLLLFHALLRLLGFGRGLAMALCAAVIVFAAPLSAALDTELDTLLYSSAFMSATVALLRREQNFTVGRSLALGFCIGASCWFRSTLLPLPPLLVLADILRGKYSRTSFLPHAAALLLAPLLLLSPWAFMTSRLGGSPLLLEKGRADCNVLAGALGITMTTEGDVFKLADLSPDTTPRRWALERYVKDPVGFFSAFIRRVIAVFSWHWALWLAFTGAFLRFRKNPVFGMAALVACYWLVLHTALMPVEPRYFIPLLPLLCAGGLALFLPRLSGDDSPTGASLFFGLLPAAGTALLAAALCLVYPSRRAAPPGPLGPGSDAWRISQEGMRGLSSGDADSALAFASAALEKDSRWPELHLNRARALLCLEPGKVSGLLSKAPGWGEDRAPRFAYFPVLSAAGKLASGGRLGGELALARLGNYWKGGIVYFRNAGTEREKALERRLYATDTAMCDVAVSEALAPLPASCRSKTLGLLAGAGLGCPQRGGI